MSISQRKDGRYVVKYKDFIGVWKPKAFNSEVTANAFDMEQRQATNKDERLSVIELIALFFRSRDISINTKNWILHFINGYTNKAGKFIEGRGSFLRDKYAEELNRRDLEMLRESLRVTGTSNNSINKMQAHIRAILAWGADQELILVNPWRDFKRLPVKKKEIKVSLEDFRLIFSNAPDWLAWAMLTAYALAMRFGRVELFSLTWDSFNFNHGYVQYYQGKTGRVKRVFPPQSYMQEAIQRYKIDMSNGIVLACHRNGKKVLDYRKSWSKAVKDAGLSNKKIRAYDIRHLAATEMLAAGADLAAVAAQLGHSSIQTTATTYAHVTPNAQARAAALMPDLNLVQLGASFDDKNKTL